MENSENLESLRPRDSLNDEPAQGQSSDGEEKHNVEIAPSPNQELGSTVDAPPDKAVLEKEEEWEYITGLKAMLVIAALILACFLMLLDNSIVATVSHAIPASFHFTHKADCRLFLESQMTSIL